MSGKYSESLKGLGPKYGIALRKRFSQIYRLLHRKRQCPSCGKWTLKRRAAGIWYCRRCGYKLAGGAYQP